MKRFLYLTAVMVLTISCQHSTDSRPAPQAGSVVRDTINGVPCCVYMPAGYSQVAGAQKFPVLYLQHGMYGNEDDWTAKGRLVEIMDSLLQAGEVKEMVVIMPDNCPSYPTSEEERAHAMNGEWIARFADFMAASEARYAISRAPSQRAIVGLSMGGFHTMHVSHHLAGQFAYVGLFSAAILPVEAHPIYDNWEQEVREQMQSTRLYWIGIGREDFLYNFNTEYRRWLEQNNIEYTYYESPGGHTWDNWQEYLCRFLKKVTF